MFDKLGLQMWTLRDYMDTPEGVRMCFRRMKESGYDLAQTAGCKIPYEDYARIAREEGIAICGTHLEFEDIVNDTEETIRKQKLLDSEFMGIGGFHCDSVEATEDFREKANIDGARINGGYMVLEPGVFDYIEGDSTFFEKEPMHNLVRDGELAAYKYDGFWKCMDTARERDELSDLIETGRAPWIKW